MKATIWHNPNCGTSRKTLEILRESGAGTIEFLYENGEFYFIEMNTRLQVGASGERSRTSSSKA